LSEKKIRFTSYLKKFQVKTETKEDLSNDVSRKTSQREKISFMA